MRALGISLGLILVLVVFGTYVFKDTAAAQGNLVADMLDLPAPPPPNPLTSGLDRQREDSFYSSKKPPADDAPIEDLIDYWSASRYGRTNAVYPDPSETVIQRLKDAIRNSPELLLSLVNILPDDSDTVSFVKSISDHLKTTARIETGGEEEGEGDPESVKTWLKYNSPEYNDELLAGASEVKDNEGYVTNQEDLLALSRFDPERAAPILDRLHNDSSQPVSQTLAKWALYRRAMDTKSLGDIEKYRDELKAIVENKDAPPGMRDLAIDALLLETGWDGRDDWYFSLMADESLAVLKVGDTVHTGLTTYMQSPDLAKDVDKMIELLKSSNPTVRNAAVRNLASVISRDNPEIVRALLPWLEDPKWAREVENERATIVEALQAIEMPESVPGLIEMLDQTSKVVRRSNSNSNTIRYMANSNSDSVEAEVDFEMVAHRLAAVKALGMQKDQRAVPALRRVLYVIEGYERGTVVRSVWLCKGFSIKEQVDSLETYARATAKQEAAINSNTFSVTGNSNRPVDPNKIDIGQMLGEQLLQNEQAEEALVSAAVDRIDVLARRDRATSAKMASIVEDWNGEAVNALMLRNLKNGRAGLDATIKLLSLRKELMEKQSNAVYDARGGTPAALGIATCILNNNGDYDAVLAGDNAEAKTAMLACARLVRADLPVNSVTPYLGSADKTLATAAERYLEANDSPEARMAVLARHPGKARVLGSRISFAPGDEARAKSSRYLQPLFASVPGAYIYASYMLDSTSEDLEDTEKRLRKEVLENEELLGMYGYDSNYIRIYKDKAVFSWEDDEARYYERTLDPREFERFKNFLVSNNADSQPPYITPAPHHGESSTAELVMIGRQGGRRVYFSSPSKSKFFEGLDGEFEEMRKPPAKLHYWLEKDVPGLEILFSDKNLKAKTLWKSAAGLSLLIHDEEKEGRSEEELAKIYSDNSSGEIDYERLEEMISRRRGELQYAHLSWHSFAGKLGGPVAQPPEVPLIVNDRWTLTRDDDNLYRIRSGNLELRTSTDGLFKVVNGQMTRIKEGYHNTPFAVPGGKWAFAVTGYYPGDLERINLLTGRSTEVKVPNSEVDLTAVAYVTPHNKVFIMQGSRYEITKTAGDRGFLIDAETGVMQPVKGEFRPLLQQTLRGLQKGPGPDEYWAAISVEKATEIGIYNMRTFSFKPLQKVPRISFSSMDMWVDDMEGKIYLTYQGHLLAIPLKK